MITCQDERAKLDRMLAGRRHPPPRLPWEYDSAEEVSSARVEDKALSLLASGSRLPYDPNDVNDVSLTQLLEPMLAAEVRRDLRAERVIAQGKGDGTARDGIAPGAFADGMAEVFLVEATLEKLKQLRVRIAEVVMESNFRKAAELQVDGRPATSTCARSARTARDATRTRVAMVGWGGACVAMQ